MSESVRLSKHSEHCFDDPLTFPMLALVVANVRSGAAVRSGAVAVVVGLIAVLRRERENMMKEV